MVVRDLACLHVFKSCLMLSYIMQFWEVCGMSVAPLHSGCDGWLDVAMGVLAHDHLVC